MSKARVLVKQAYFWANNKGDSVNDKYNIEKLEKKIDKLEQDLNKFCNEDENFSQTKLNK